MPAEQVSPGDSAHAAEQLRLQAAQLAEHLRARQKDLDHREAMLNAQAAQLDRDARTARLWLSERMAELEERGATAPADAPGGDPLPRKAAALEARQRELAESETQLARQLAEVQQLHENLLGDRRFLEEAAGALRAQLADEHRRAMDEVRQQRRNVRRRSEQVEQSRAAMEQLRGELGRIHRETLELRLATEELWAELPGTAAPAVLTKSLARIRGKLAEEDRRANAELRRQRSELEEIRGQLVEQHEALARRKRQFDDWLSGCRQQADAQAARLIARQKELDQREADLVVVARGWQAERLQYQQEIRRLRGQSAQAADATLGPANQ